MTDQMEESRGTLLSVFGFLVAKIIMIVVNFCRLAVGLVQNPRPQCNIDDRLVVTTADLFLSFLNNEFSSCVVDSEKMFDFSGIVAEM